MKGWTIRKAENNFLISFDSVTNAVLCALDIQDVFKQTFKIENRPPIKLKVGLSAGVPVSEREMGFLRTLEDTIQLAERLCDVVQGEIVISYEVKDLYENENLNTFIKKKHIIVLESNDEKLLNILMNYIEKEWRNSSLNTEDSCKSMGYSKSQLYRKITALTGQPQNLLFKQYRLNQARKLLHNKNKNISQIAFETGFNTPAYFSKCFQETFGILPSSYLKSYRS